VIHQGAEKEVEKVWKEVEIKWQKKTENKKKWKVEIIERREIRRKRRNENI